MPGDRLVTITDFDAAGITAEFVGAGSAACVVRLTCTPGNAESWSVLARFPLRALHWPPLPACAAGVPTRSPEAELMDRRDQACFDAVGAWFPHHDAPDALPGIVGAVVRGEPALRHMLDACRGLLGEGKQWAALSDVGDLADAGHPLWMVGELMGDAFQLPRLPASISAPSAIVAVSVELKPKWGVMPAYRAAVNVETGECVDIDALKLKHERCEMMAAFAAVKAAKNRKDADAGLVAAPSSWVSGVRLFQQDRTTVATELKALRDSPFSKQALTVRPASAQCPRRGVPIRATPRLPPGERLSDGIVDVLATAVSLDPSIARVLYLQRFGIAPSSSPVPIEVLDIELLTTMHRWLAQSCDGTVNVKLHPAACTGASGGVMDGADWTVTADVLREWTSRFYSSVTAKDVSLTLMLALEERLWQDSRSQDLRESCTVQACCLSDGGGSAGCYDVVMTNAPVGSLRLNVLDFDSKRHKPLQWYLDRDRAFLDALRATQAR